MENRLKLFFAQKALYHVKKALEYKNIKEYGISLYGTGYKNSMEYAGIELKEKWHILMHDIFDSLI